MLARKIDGTEDSASRFAREATEAIGDLPPLPIPSDGARRFITLYVLLPSPVPVGEAWFTVTSPFDIEWGQIKHSDETPIYKPAAPENYLAVRFHQTPASGGLLSSFLTSASAFRDISVSTRPVRRCHT